MIWPQSSGLARPTAWAGWLGRLMLLMLCWSVATTAVAARGTHADWMGTVTHVTDGDTLWVRPARGGAPRKIRIDGIDAPEICQAYGVAARAALTAQVQGQSVQVTGRRTDDYGRLLARLTVQGEDIGVWMVLQGHAWSYRSQRDAGPYAQQESWARAQGLGLWQTRAMAPRTFRKRHGSCH